MATSFSQTSIDLTTDAGFRAWGAAVSAALTAVGLVRVTGETGIIDWSTATRAAGGFDLYRFDDALQATKPVFVKIGIAAGGWNGSRCPANVCIGNGTDGSGNMTGVFTDTAINSSGGISQCGVSSSLANAGSPVRNNYACFSGGMLTLAWGVNPSTDNSSHFFAVSRTVNDVGNATGDGACLFNAPSSSGSRTTGSCQVLNFKTPAIGATSSGSQTCMVANGITSSLIAGTPQVFKHYIASPKIRPIPVIISFISAEIAMDDTFTVKPIGGASGTSRTYRTLTNRIMTGANNVSGTSIAILWE